MKIGIIGATGWLGSALGSHLLRSKVVDAEDLVLLNRSGPHDHYHGYRDVTWARHAADLVAQCDVVVLSVRPDDWQSLQLEAPDRLVISFMAGVTLAQLRACRGRVVRAMPNAAAGIGASYSPWLGGPDLAASDRDTVRTILGVIGTEDEVAEEYQIDLMTAAPGSGAAYPALMAVAVADWLMIRGVPEPAAWRAAEGMISGGARLLDVRPGNVPAIIKGYRDYRGTTAAGLAAAEASGFTSSMHQALDAAAEVARKISAGK